MERRAVAAGPRALGPRRRWQRNRHRDWTLGRAGQQSELALARGLRSTGDAARVLHTLRVRALRNSPFRQQPAECARTRLPIASEPRVIYLD